MSTLRSIQQLDALRDEWDQLAAPFGSPLLDHDWFLSCARTLHAASDLRIVCIRSGGRLTAVAPLVIQQTSTGRRLSLLGAAILHEPGGLLFADEAALAELIQAITRLGSPSVIERVPDDSLLCQRLASVTRGRAVSFIRPTHPSLGVPISGTWDAYWAQLSSRITGNLPRLEARARRACGSLRSRVIEPTPEEVDGLFDQLMQVEASGWKGRKGSALLQRSAMQAFFRHYSRLAAARGRLRVTIVEFGEQVAAVELAVRAYNRVWQLKMGFEEGFSSYYPGLHLTRASIRAAFEQGASSYEFLGSAEEWEERWRPEKRRYNLVMLYPYSLRGFAGACRDVAAKLRSRTSPVPAAVDAA